jgi:hypothetical protein
MRTLLFPLLLAWLLPGMALDAEEFPDPVPRLTRTKLIKEWTFDAGTEGWTAENQCSLTASDGHLKIESTGSDPFFHLPVDLPGGNVVVRLRVRSRVAQGGSVFWITDKAPARSEQRRSDFPIVADGKWVETETRIDAPGRFKDLRIDPGFEPGLIEIDWIQIVNELHHPLTATPLEVTPQAVRFAIKNHRDTPVSFSTPLTQKTVGPNEQYVLEQPVSAAQPLQKVTLELSCEDWPTLTRSVWVENESVQTQWIERPLGDYQLQIAADGTTARVRKAGQLVATLSPLVMVDETLPKLRLVENGDAIRFEGDGIKVLLLPHESEVTIEIESDRECEGPVVRAKGSLEQGIFAGLEYLGRGERSSSKIDIETEGHMRFVPDPLKVTLPLMSFVTDRVTVAMTWDDMQLQPVYATPNVFDGTPDHRMALRGKHISCTLRPDQLPAEETIYWAVKKKGLPPLPEAPRSREQQAELCLKALNGPLKTDEGWGHCVQENWKRQPFAPMASTLWRLGAEVPEYPRWVLGGSHVPNGTVYFVTGRAQEWLDMQARQVAGLISQQGADGSYRYNGPFQRGHFENTASGQCGRPAAVLLEYAYVTGDQEALKMGLKALEFAKRFRTPRGAQVWECTLHVPDQLASAYLVWAYARGYELTGDEQYLQHARKWALSGIPFTYLWNCYPIMAYSTPPVFGATHLKAPNWMGLPVQWVGGVYAYALTRLVPHDSTLDWNHLARGILISAQQQQYPDGPHVGLLPDSFNLRRQRRQPADINPCALVSLQLVLDGEVDFLSVATDGEHRIAAPFPVTIKDGVAHIQARAGVDYQVVINGTRIVDVKSKGNDAIRLER